LWTLVVLKILKSTGYHTKKALGHWIEGFLIERYISDGLSGYRFPWPRTQDFLETVGMAVPWMPKQCRTAFQKIHPYIYGELLAESHRHSLPFGE
jgi:hypothetical protein